MNLEKLLIYTRRTGAAHKLYMNLLGLYLYKGYTREDYTRVIYFYV